MNKLSIKVLTTLWKWKLLSTRALHALCFPGHTGNGAYSFLWRMSKKGWIKCVQIPGEIRSDRFAWTLTTVGFRGIIEDHLPELKESGFGSESYEHDSKVSAIHLGEWLLGIPQDCDVFSEQCLRRLDPDCYPDWVPRTAARRPDGYWLTQIGGKAATVAFELERTHKSKSDYSAMGKFYDECREIYSVIWVVENSKRASQVHSLLTDKGGNSGSCPHYVFVLTEVCSVGWFAKSVAGFQRGISINQVLQNKMHELRKNSCIVHALDFRKCPIRSEASKRFPAIENPVCVVSTPLCMQCSTRPPYLTDRKKQEG